jgi:hypothetical protein
LWIKTLKYSIKTITMIRIVYIYHFWPRYYWKLLFFAGHSKQMSQGGTGRRCYFNAYFKNWKGIVNISFASGQNYYVFSWN